MKNKLEKEIKNKINRRDVGRRKTGTKNFRNADHLQQ
jgi:hypothetical protein